MCGHLQLLKRLNFEFVVQARRESWADAWKRAKQLFGFKDALKPLKLGPSSSQQHLVYGAGDANANALKRHKTRVSLLGKHDVDRVFKRLQRIRGAAISPHSESTVALLFAEVCHKAKTLRDPDV